MKNDKWLNLTNGVCWSIIFSLAAIIMSVVAMAHTHPRTLYSADDKTVVLGFDYIGVIVAILALLVTFLVAWQIYSTIRSTRQIENIEDEFEELKKTVDGIVDAKIFVLERETSAMICHNLAKSPIHLHQFSEALNKRFGTDGITNMLDQSLYYIAVGLDNLSKLENSGNYDDLYDELTATIVLIENCERSLQTLTIGVIDKVIEGIKKDKNPHDGVKGDGVNKKDLIARLERIKSNAIALKAPEANPDTPNGN